MLISKQMKLVRRMLPAFLTTLFLACGDLAESPTGPGGGTEPLDPSATFARVQAEVFTPTCALAGCHDTFGREAGLLLLAGQSHGNIVNRASTQIPSMVRVRPGATAESYLFLKITGDPRITGTKMPQGGSLTTDQINLVRQWIRRGAPND